MSNFLKYTLIGFLVILLILIRAFEDNLFYDPFIDFFKQDSTYIQKPTFDSFLLLLNQTFRYFLNTIISLMILYFFFNDKQLVRISIILYVILFAILMILYFYLINNRLEENYLFTFYIRRFLIQPLFVFILIPAFYYHKKTS